MRDRAVTRERVLAMLIMCWSIIPIMFTTTCGFIVTIKVEKKEVE